MEINKALMLDHVLFVCRERASVFYVLAFYCVTLRRRNKLSTENDAMLGGNLRYVTLL